jgi:hypothetical protein
MQFLLHNISELVGLLVAIFFYKYIKDSFMKWFLPFLAFVFAGELFTTYKFYYNHSWSNINVYYLIGIIELVFYSYIFYQLIPISKIRKMIFYTCCINLILYTFSFLIYKGDYNYHLITLTISGFFIAFFALSFIYIKFISDEQTLLIEEPGFWISFGVSIFFSGTSIVFSLYNFIVKNNLTLFGVKLYNFVPRVLCVILYASISIAIILCKKKTKALS